MTPDDVLKALYDADVVDEDHLKKWHAGAFKLKHLRVAVDDATVKAVKKQAEPIITWLSTVEADSAEEEEEEEEEELNPFGATKKPAADSETESDSD